MYSPEELRRVRRPHGLPLVDHGGVPAEEGGVADVLVAHDPAKVGRGPPDVARAAKKGQTVLWENVCLCLLVYHRS